MNRFETRNRSPLAQINDLSALGRAPPGPGVIGGPLFSGQLTSVRADREITVRAGATARVARSARRGICPHRAERAPLPGAYGSGGSTAAREARRSASSTRYLRRRRPAILLNVLCILALVATYLWWSLDLMS